MAKPIDKQKILESGAKGGGLGSLKGFTGGKKNLFKTKKLKKIKVKWDAKKWRKDMEKSMGMSKGGKLDQMKEWPKGTFDKWKAPTKKLQKISSEHTVRSHPGLGGKITTENTKPRNPPMTHYESWLASKDKK